MTTRAWLARAAADAGQKWAERFRAGLLRDGRVASGGWPGTLTEARTVAATYLRDDGHAPQLRGLSITEFDGFARMVNASARQGWLAWAARDAPEPSFDDDAR